MKRLIIMSAVIVAGFTACHKNIASNTVPVDVVTAFNQRYPDAERVKWETDDGMYEATFKINGNKENAYYEPDGTLVRINR